MMQEDPSSATLKAWKVQVPPARTVQFVSTDKYIRTYLYFIGACTYVQWQYRCCRKYQSFGSASQDSNTFLKLDAPTMISVSTLSTKCQEFTGQYILRLS